MNRTLLVAARAISLIFRPFYLPVAGMVALFLFSYLQLMPLAYKLAAVLIVYVLTCLAPRQLIRLYRLYQGWAPFHLIRQEARAIPYVISILCYLLCYYVMRLLHMPHFAAVIIVAAIVTQTCCAVVNTWLKISTHTAAIGATTGAVAAFAFIFNFNPVWWIAALTLLAGIIGTGRMLLRLHTLPQIVAGHAIGTVTGFITIILT